MSSGTSLLVTVQAGEIPNFNVPVPVTEGEVERETTIFHMVSADQSFSVLGTYDQIMDFAASIGQAMMTWPLVAGKSDTFFTPDNPERGKVSNDIDRHRQSAGSQRGHARNERAGSSSREARERGSGPYVPPDAA